MSETWEKVPGFDGFYEISNMGKVRSLTRFRGNGNGGYYQKGRILLGWISGGYKTFCICFLGSRKFFQLHRMLAIVFIPNPENKPCINHKNGKKLDNRLKNLEWVTYAENNKHAYDIGLKEGSDKRAVIQYDLNGRFIQEFDSAMRASKVTGILRQHIVRHLSGKRPTAGYFLWKYKDQIKP